METVAVAEESGEVSDYRVGFWTWGFGTGLRFRFQKGGGEEEEANDAESEEYKKGSSAHVQVQHFGLL